MAETGHARNIEHLNTMIAFVTGYGAAYAPSNAAITLAALTAKLTASNTALDGVTTAVAPYNAATNARENEFVGIRKLVIRVVNSFAASGAAKNTVEDAKSFKRKIDGARAKVPKAKPAVPGAPTPVPPTTISVAQTSYTQIVEHLDNLIELCSGEPLYNPNETPLKVVQLTAKSTALKAANDGVATAFAPLSNARITRNDVLYAADTGLVDLAGLVKKYVKSLYGGDSPQYKQISGLEFRAVK